MNIANRSQNTLMQSLSSTEEILLAKINHVPQTLSLRSVVGSMELNVNGRALVFNKTVKLSLYRAYRSLPV